MRDPIEWKPRPSTEEYAAALSRIRLRIKPNQHRLLVEQYHCPERAATSVHLAASLGLKSHAPVCGQYGKLGHRLCDVLGRDAPFINRKGKPEWWPVLSTGWREDRKPKLYTWRMLPEVAEALEKLHWVEGAACSIPQEVDEPNRYYEGAVSTIPVVEYERSGKARDACVAHYGRKCAACGLCLADVYGDAAEGLIHVHHLRQLASITRQYQVDPIADLRPVCPNCHAVIHSRRPLPYSIEEVAAMLKERSESREKYGSNPC